MELMQSTVGAVVAHVATTLATAGVVTAEGDARIIVAHAMGLRREEIESVEAHELTAEQLAQIADHTNRRSDHEPLQHLTGRAFFRSLELAVGPGVFVPRRETEFVTQLAIDALQASAAPHPIAADLGTGAGAIALSLATEMPSAEVYGVEISAEAFPWTERNFREIAPHNSHPVLADMADALHDLDGRLDVVSGNPPFIPDDVEPSAPEVRLFAPAVALFGGADGLDIVRSLSKAARRLLRPGGVLVFEHGISQAPRVAALLAADGWHAVTTHRDPRGQDRVTSARR